MLFLPAYLTAEAKRREHVYKSEIEHAHGIFRRWIDLELQGVLARKETSPDADFLRDIFGDALGYAAVTEGDPSYQLERQFSIQGVGAAGGAISGNFELITKIGFLDELGVRVTINPGHVDLVVVCLADLNEDGSVGLPDLAIMLSNFGLTPGALWEDGDLDGDGAVGLQDLALMLSLFGTICP